MTAEEAFSSLAPKMGRPSEKELKAKEFILEMLKEREMLANDCEAKLEEAGFKKSTIKKAKKKAGSRCFLKAHIIQFSSFPHKKYDPYNIKATAKNKDT